MDSEYDPVDRWSQYVNEHVGDLTAKDIAARMDVSESAVGNWLRGENFSRPDPWRVRDFAKAFRRPVQEALIAAGFDPVDFDNPEAKPISEVLRGARTRELIDELKHRIEWVSSEDRHENIENPTAATREEVHTATVEPPRRRRRRTARYTLQTDRPGLDRP